MTTTERIYRLALYACPDTFRDEFGEESVHDFLRLADEKRRQSGRLGVGLLCCRAVMDLLRTAVRERRRVGKHPSSLNLNALPQNLRDARRNLIATPGFFDPRDFALHTRRDSPSLVSAVRAEVWSIDPEQPIASIRTMDEIVAAAAANDRVQTLLLTTFALVALLLAALGIYGVLTHAVSQRTGEIGLRMALGARTSDVLRMVDGEGMVLTLLGIGLGLVGASVLGRVLEGMLYGIEPGDPWTIGGVAGLLGAVALAASLLPAFRATRIDPLDGTSIEEQA